jgi:hypothetical protein
MADLTHTQATLLWLPTELRLQILEEAIAVRRTAPESPSASQSRLKFHNLYDHLWSEGTRLYVEDADAAKSAQPSLLATSRQIRAETQDIIRRVSGNPYTLDVMCVNGYGLMPSWVSRPCLSKRIGKLDLRIRFFDNPDPHLYGNSDHDIDSTWYLPQWNTVVLLTSYVLQACWKPGVFDVEPRRSRNPAEGEVAKEMAREPSRNKWCAIDDITITVESTNIPMKPRHPKPRTSFANGGNFGPTVHDSFAYDIFHGSDRWPAHVARPRSKPNCRYGPEYRFAREICDVIGYLMCQPNGLHAGLLLTNVGRLNILVDDEIYERFDITKRFWELYKPQRAIQRLVWDLTQAAHKRKQLDVN